MRKREIEWLPWKQTASSFAGVVLALTRREASEVWPASPSSQDCNLIKHFGAGSPVPPITLLGTACWLPKSGLDAGKVLHQPCVAA